MFVREAMFALPVFLAIWVDLCIDRGDVEPGEFDALQVETPFLMSKLGCWQLHSSKSVSVGNGSIIHIDIELGPVGKLGIGIGILMSSNPLEFDTDGKELHSGPDVLEHVEVSVRGF